MKRLLAIFLISFIAFSANAQNGLNMRPATARLMQKNKKAKPVVYEGEIISKPDMEPEFPGGFVELNRYIRDSIRYPEEARERRVTGKVYATFVVERDGVINDIVIKKDIGHGCGEEVKRLIGTMPKWKPGMHRNVPQRCLAVLCIYFGNGMAEVDTY